MILDELNEFADAAVVPTTGTGRLRVGDEVDLGVKTGNNRDIGNGEELFLVIQVDTAFTSGGAATVSFELVSDAQVPITVNATETIHFATPAFALSALVAGATLAALRLPMGVYERYLGVNANVGTAALTAGRVNAFLTHDAARWTAQPDAIN